MGMTETKKQAQTGVLVAVADKQERQERIEEYLDELEFLASTLNLKTTERFFQKLEHPDPRTF